MNGRSSNRLVKDDLRASCAEADRQRSLLTRHGFRQAVAAAYRSAILQDDVVVENRHEVFAAMVALRDGNGSFADALIGALGARAGCARTLTFDLKALRLPGFALASLAYSSRARAVTGRR